MFADDIVDLLQKHPMSMEEIAFTIGYSRRHIRPIIPVLQNVTSGWLVMKGLLVLEEA
jgi:biotin operon repressor